MSLKRVNYFTHQFLREQDFKDEQSYHIEARRRHNMLLHSHAWGVADGLEVKSHGNHQVLIEPGVAIDSAGREIVLTQTVSRDLTSFGHDSEAYITIGYHEELEEEDRQSAGGVEGHTRIHEVPEIHEHHKENVEEGSIVLARVRLGAQGHIEHVDNSVRKSVKEAPAFLRGWMRVPFKPVRLSAAVVIAGASTDFIVDEAHAYCESAARGSMQIPVPPGATHVAGFRVAGSTRSEVMVRLFRTGWNAAASAGEKTKLLEETLINGSFDREVPLNVSLDESHALAVSVRAEGPSEIWLVAVKYH
jgi:hypothetical protein